MQQVSELQEQVKAVLDHERQLQAHRASSENTSGPPQNGSVAGLPPEVQALQFLNTIALGCVLLSVHFRLHCDVYKHSIRLRHLQYNAYLTLNVRILYSYERTALIRVFFFRLKQVSQDTGQLRQTIEVSLEYALFKTSALFSYSLTQSLIQTHTHTHTLSLSLSIKRHFKLTFVSINVYVLEMVIDRESSRRLALT